MMFAASGGAAFYKSSPKCIRFAYHGCTNRPFFHIVVMETRKARNAPVIEQLGTFDPMKNVNGEKLCALNLERICYWLADKNVSISQPCQELFGLAGLLPIHPRTYMHAWRQRRKNAEPKDETQSS